MISALLRLMQGMTVLAVGLVIVPLVNAQEHGEIEPFTSKRAPTLIILNGKVWTGVRGAPEGEALAVTGSTITAVGSSEDIRKLADSRTQVIDAAGRRIIPGITDSHTHIINAGLQLSRLYLREVRDKEQFVNAVAAAVTRLTPGQWLLGGRYSVESWENSSSPSKEWIDEVTPGTPVFLTRMDGHQALANSVALKYARIDANGPPDPPGGEIERHPATGEPTGILKDAAMELVSTHIPKTNKREKYEALQLIARVANAWGITSVHDMSEPDDLPVFLMARRRGVLSIRVYSYVMTEELEKTWPTIKALETTGDDMFRVQGFKTFMDGSLGSRTAYMHEPYTDATPQTTYPRGMRSAQAADLDALRQQIKWALDHGLQIAVHAIGDQANHELLDILASLPDCPRRRHRTEHAQHLLPEDITRFAELGVIASMQPFHKADDGRYAEQALGPIRARTSYAFNDLLRSGATVCFGSDVPVVTNNPFSGMAAAVSAKTLTGEAWVPSQSISREAALRCYTVTPPHAVFQEDVLGALEVGKLADIVILNTDILTAPIDEIHRTEAYITIVDGKIVHPRPNGQ